MTEEPILLLYGGPLPGVPPWAGDPYDPRNPHNVPRGPWAGPPEKREKKGCGSTLIYLLLAAAVVATGVYFTNRALMESADDRTAMAPARVNIQAPPHVCYKAYGSTDPTSAASSQSPR